MIFQRIHKPFYLIKLENKVGNKFEIKQNKTDTSSNVASKKGSFFQGDEFEGQHSFGTTSLSIFCRLRHIPVHIYSCANRGLINVYYIKQFLDYFHTNK